MTQKVTRQKGEPAVSLALAGGATVTDAAKAGGISRRTVQRRLDDPKYREDVRRLQGEFVQTAIGKLATLSVGAVATLEEVMAAPMASWECLERGNETRAGVWRRVGVDPGTQVHAARAALDGLIRVQEHVDRSASDSTDQAAGLIVDLVDGIRRSRGLSEEG